MVLTRVAVRIAFLVSACAMIGAPAVNAGAPPAAPPDASYAFVLSKGGQKIGNSTVNVKRDAGNVAIHEAETFANINGQYIVDETVEPVGLTPTSYATTFPLNQVVTVTAHLAFDAGGARLTVDGTAGATDFRMAKDTTHQVVIDGLLVSGFLLLPAQAAAQNLTQFTSLAPANSSQVVLSVDRSKNPTRPSAVPAGDSSLSIGGPVDFVEWYDPKTMVVDEVDVPSQQVTISRTPGK
jgi:hypothetical protein